MTGQTRGRGVCTAPGGPEASQAQNSWQKKSTTSPLSRINSELVVRSYRVAKRSFVWRETQGSAMAVHQPHPSPCSWESRQQLLLLHQLQLILVKRLLVSCSHSSGQHQSDTLTFSNDATTMCSWVVRRRAIVSVPTSPSSHLWRSTSELQRRTSKERHVTRVALAALLKCQ